MEICGGRIREKIVKPDSVVTEIEITTKKSSCMKTVRNRSLNVSKISIPVVSIPSRRIMDADKKQIGIRKDKKDPKNTTRNKGNRKAE